MRKRAICPGSMGELVQGFREGKEVLISLPIDRYSEMEVIWQEEKRGKEKRNILWKSEKALEIALREWGMEHLVGQVAFRRLREIPEGKGLASSTADIAALLGALADTLTLDREKLRKNWERHRRDVEEAFYLVERGLEEGDLSLVGRGATLSGEIVQEAEKEDLWEKVISLYREIGAVGVNRAHTGRALMQLFLEE